VAAEPNNPAAYRCRAEVLQKQGNAATAEADVAKAKQLEQSATEP
jgi:hypothetical protein